MNTKQKTQVIEEMKKDIASKELDQFYGKSAAREIRESYGFYKENNLDQLATYLRETRVPEYVILSNQLRELVNYNTDDLEKAIVLLKHENYKGEMTDKEIKTTYKEFKKIERKSKKLKIEQAVKLNRYSDIRYFVKYDYNIVLAKLLNQKINLENRAELINFFDNCEELRFLDNSKLIKKSKVKR